MPDYIYSYCDDDVSDPFPDDEGYETYRRAVMRLELRARRLYSNKAIRHVEHPQRRHSTRARRTNLVRSRGPHRRAPRVRCVTRRITGPPSSGIGNESSDCDPESPSQLWQCRSSRRNKKFRELSSRLLSFGPVSSSLAVSP